MTKLLINSVKKRKSENELRSALSYLGGITGIFLNLLLCTIKFTLGVLTGALSVTADAINNLMDCASNIVSLTGTKLSVKPDDKEHPFGHGRIEYISALIVAISIFVVSFELAKASVEKIITPKEIELNIWYVALLIITILVKLWMAYFNSKLFNLTDNLNLKGVKTDSINDSVVTLSTIVSIIMSSVFGLKFFDGIMGLIIAVFIFASGVNILKDVLSPLIGEPPSKEVTEEILSIITESDIILGVHDLVIHSYGKNRTLASADAEVDAKADIFEIHSAIDKAEQKIKKNLGIIICIHSDPVDTRDRKTERMKKEVGEIIKDYNSLFSFHDFMISEKDENKKITFDLAIPFDNTPNKETIKEELQNRLSKHFPDYTVKFNIEHSYV